MKCKFCTFYILMLCFLLLRCDEEMDPVNFIEQLNKQLGQLNNKYYIAEWNYVTNPTPKNKKLHLEKVIELSKFKKVCWMGVTKYKWNSYRDEYLRRQFKLFVHLEEEVLSDDRLNAFTQLLDEMKECYSQARICSYHNKTDCSLSLEPDIQKIMRESRDPRELRHVWIKWRDAVGQNLRKTYQDYVELLNQAAALNLYNDASKMWLAPYECEDIKSQIKIIWKQMKPFYDELHAYVRYKLRSYYGKVVSEKAPIPVHLLGDLWAQSWTSTLDITQPFPNRTSLDITDELVKQNYTSLKIYKTAEAYLISLGLAPITRTFWDKSILEKPSKKDIIYYPTLFNFYDGDDYRALVFTEINQKSFLQAHTFLMFIEYYMLYSNQPEIYQNFPIPDFGVAISNLPFLFTLTRKHLKKLGLLQDTSQNQEDVINKLYLKALYDIAFMPYAYIVDLWRWDVFSGRIKPDDYNCKWWKLRLEYQGVEPPEDRSEENFDIVSKFHVVANEKYIYHFLGTIMQYQIYKGLCIKSGNYEPNNPETLLCDCDISGNKEAGKVLKEVLSLGASKPWQDVLEVATGEKKMDANAILEYYSPLIKWLTDYNKKNKVRVGWKKPTKVCS